MKSLIESTVKILRFLWSLICSSEGISTLLVALIMVLKLYINNTATRLQKKTFIVSIPSELTVLIVGFLISAIITNNPNKDHIAIIVLIIISLFLLVLLYASERALENQLSGNWGLSIWARVLMMYLVSSALYCLVVFGGVI